MKKLKLKLNATNILDLRNLILSKSNNYLDSLDPVQQFTIIERLNLQELAKSMSQKLVDRINKPKTKSFSFSMDPNQWMSLYRMFNHCGALELDPDQPWIYALTYEIYTQVNGQLETVSMKIQAEDYLKESDSKPIYPYIGC